jgi:hypothetical protein
VDHALQAPPLATNKTPNPRALPRTNELELKHVVIRSKQEQAGQPAHQFLPTPEHLLRAVSGGVLEPAVDVDDGEVGLERVGDDHAAGAQHALDSQREPRARFRVPAPGADLFLFLLLLVIAAVRITIPLHRRGNPSPCRGTLVGLWSEKGAKGVGMRREYLYHGGTGLARLVTRVVGGGQAGGTGGDSNERVEDDGEARRGVWDLGSRARSVDYPRRQISRSGRVDGCDQDCKLQRD